MDGLIHIPVGLARSIHRHPFFTFLVVLVLLGGAAFGFWRYAIYQWHAAQAAVKDDHPQEALRRLALCLRVWPDSPEVLVLAARASRLSGDFQAAEGYLNRCLKLQRGSSDAVQVEFRLMRVQAGELDEEPGRGGPVTELFEAVMNGHPDTSMILETIAKAYLQRLRYKLAYGCLNLWIEREPRNPKPYYWRGWTLERINNPKAAKEDYERALEIDPDMILARLRLAEMLLQDKQAPEALPHLERLNRQSPDDPRIQSRLGMCLFLQGRSKEARRLMEAALIQLPTDPALLNALAGLDVQEGRGVDAERHLRTVLATDPADTEALFLLASALQLQGRNEEAAAAIADHGRKKDLVDRINLLLRDVADSPTAGPNDSAEIGRLFLQIGRDKEGVYWLERAIEQDSANQTAHRALLDYYESKGDTAKAAVHRRQVRSVSPKQPNPAPNQP